MHKDVIAAVESTSTKQDAPEDPRSFTSLSGVKFHLRPVAPFLMRDIAKRLPVPKVPQVYIPDKGTTEENPSDPDYIAAVEEYNARIGELNMSLVFSMGTSLANEDELERLGIPKPNDPWVEDIEEVAPGITFDLPKSGKARYVAWMKYIVFPEPDDLYKVMRKVMTLGGVVMEQAVQDAEDSFRSDPEGDGTPRLSLVEGDSELGDSSGAAISGSSSGV